jgi:tRNA (guanine37-N1)-methyltransferase
LFPKPISEYLSSSVLGRASRAGLLRFNLVNLREFGEGPHQKVDDRPFGGGAGMVLMAGPLVNAVRATLRGVRDRSKVRILLFSAKGKPFTQADALRWASRYRHLVLLAGRYEGVDERVRKILSAEEISIGPYVLTDGDVPAMAVASAVGRLVSGVIKECSLVEESHAFNNSMKGMQVSTRKRRLGGMLEYPHYTRPAVFIHKRKRFPVPRVLTSGDHAAIRTWRSMKLNMPKKR